MVEWSHQPANSGHLQQETVRASHSECTATDTAHHTAVWSLTVLRAALLQRPSHTFLLTGHCARISLAMGRCSGWGCIIWDNSCVSCGERSRGEGEGGRGGSRGGG